MLESEPLWGWSDKLPRPKPNQIAVMSRSATAIDRVRRVIKEVGGVPPAPRRRGGPSTERERVYRQVHHWRRQRARGELAPALVSALESLPGWTWDLPVRSRLIRK